MRQVLLIIIKCLLCITLGVSAVIIAIAFMLALAEEDLSHGLFYYL